MSEKKKEMLFARGVLPGGTPFLMLGVTAEAWEHMKEGMTHNFDLRKAGIDLVMTIFGGADQQAVMKVIDQAMHEANLPYLDARGENFNIDEPKKH